MASTINASTTGGGGIISSADSSGVLQLQTAGTTAVTVDASQNVLVTGGGGLGYGTGSGGTVTQITNRNTAVTLNKTTGSITLVSAAGSASWAGFVVNNSTVAATDIIVLSIKSGLSNFYLTQVYGVTAGSFAIGVSANSGTTTEAPVINFAVIKGATS